MTPTGAAILSVLSEDFGDIPPMNVEKIGYGVGTKDLSLPNVMRILSEKRTTYMKSKWQQLSSNHACPIKTGSCYSAGFDKLQSRAYSQEALYKTVPHF